MGGLLGDFWFNWMELRYEDLVFNKGTDSRYDVRSRCNLAVDARL